MIHVFVKPGIESSFEINVSSHSGKVFKEMVQRACNLWPDAPAEIKEFADIITNGQPMQNYMAHPHLSGKYGPKLIPTTDTELQGK